MASKFYNSVIEEEKKAFDIKDEDLRNAARDISITYSERSLKRGTTSLDYGIPANRCAYLYKYSTLHTGMVTKYFRKLVKKKEIRRNILNKKTIKICCLGGGPGTDVIGISKALAIMPSFHNKITQVSVLDICGGWKNSFGHIVSRLLDGKVKDVPETFITKQKFKHELIEVNLLDPLAVNVQKIISNADIICMVKFVSVILTKKESTNALKALGYLFKQGAVVLFIDNFRGNVCESVEAISKETGLDIVLGPLHERFVRPSKTNEAYGCVPQAAAKLSVVGWIKNPLTSVNTYNLPSDEFSSISYDDKNWETDSERDIPIQSQADEELDASWSFKHAFIEKSTQTEWIPMSNEENDSMSNDPEDMLALVEALEDLLKVLAQSKKMQHRNKCYCCQHYC